MKKKFLSILLTAIMIVSLLPVTAFAGPPSQSKFISTGEFIGGSVETRVNDSPASLAKINDTVTLVVSPDENYRLKSLEVYDNNDELTELVEEVSPDKLEYSFLMPGNNISVKAEFEKIEEPDPCTYNKPVKLTEGIFGMKLNFKDAGWFKFEEVDGGWKICKSSKPGSTGMMAKPYLAMQDGKLVYTDYANATVWTYRNGAFSTSVKTSQKTNGYWLGFIYVPAATKNVTTTYYLSTVTDGAKLSTYYVSAELYEEVTGEHKYGWAIYADKTNHKYVCMNCGDVKTEPHDYNEETGYCVCGAFNPEKVNVKISVDVKEKTTKQFSGFLLWGTWKDVTTYTATIKTEAVGVKVTKVQYQLGGSSKWITGSSICSDKPIETLKIKVWDNKGNVYEYEYPEAPATGYTLTISCTAGITHNGVTQESYTINNVTTFTISEEDSYVVIVNGENYRANGTLGGWIIVGEGDVNDGEHTLTGNATLQTKIPPA